MPGPARLAAWLPSPLVPFCPPFCLAEDRLGRPQRGCGPVEDAQLPFGQVPRPSYVGAQTQDFLPRAPDFSDIPPRPAGVDTNSFQQ
jgi:hypothetical protein